MTRGRGPLSQTRRRCATCCCLPFVLFSRRPHILPSPWRPWGAQKEMGGERKHSFIAISLWKKKKKCRLAELLDLNVVFFLQLVSLHLSEQAGAGTGESLCGHRENARQSKDGIYLQPAKRTDEYRRGGRRRFHPDIPSPWLPVKEAGIAALNETPLPHSKWRQRPNHDDRPLTTYATRRFRVC